MKSSLIYLAQSDTTVGFLSKDKEALANTKERPPLKPFVMCVDSFRTLQEFVRVPKKYKNRIRKSEKTTFVLGKQAYRVVQNSEHQEFLKKYRWMYSSSANKSGQNYDEVFAKDKANMIVEDNRGLKETTPSKIYKLTNNKSKRLR
ncbi:MAG: TsaC protein (YrdC domain) required for threonylcarbamoyladenosine t(6)A37 modification in tRNA [uncultured Campylobacterales bacterium]|uniref:TsaC protein (YrdC domain) required for threonylcarbamoyladenosine t(6)A37 modification in tRNA n=1 Tax=uncultured Campylobacterales bacterium TaxID=352960 RepID=A0A6S6T1Q5_9BACT|nr:MAG: TsaC protein (YrdC domain) required for threonylcarbamoyladenosine t(6)A37 modification in tRNA [uncultured Campylobacterales bacterium]